jgi:hypothetical protein
MAVTESAPGAGHARTPVHLWIVGVISLLWNAMGAFDYLASQLKLEFYMSQFTEEQLAYFYEFPAWATSGWAFGVWGALAGSILLLMRRKWAVWAFAISLAGLAISSLYSLVLSEGLAIMGTGAFVFNAVIWVIAIALFIYARAQAKRGVLA